jgi:hypothetical protein
MSIRSFETELQQVFGQAAALPFNAYSKQVFTRLYRCHTAAIGVHTYKCSDPACNHLHHEYHPSFIGTAVTAIAPTVAD